MKQYIDSQEHWEDSINSDHEERERIHREQQEQIDKQMYEFMQEHGLGDEDMINDITYPHEL
jgi:hypothetical protein